MIARLAYGYVRLLWVLEILLFTASLMLHVSVFIVGATERYAEYGIMLFRGEVIVGILVIAFVKDGLRWMDQIKSCPKWMWRAALILGVYGLFSSLLPYDPSISAPWTMSGLPLGFDAISFCILYSVLGPGYLEKSEVVRRALHSIIMGTLIVIVCLAYRAGYLRQPKSYLG